VNGRKDEGKAHYGAHYLIFHASSTIRYGCKRSIFATSRNNLRPKGTDMKQTVLAIGTLLITICGTTAQDLVEIQKHETGHRSAIQSAPHVSTVAGAPQTDEWKTVMRKVAIYHTKDDSVTRFKEAKLETKALAEIGIGNDMAGGRAVTPIIGTGINGTTMTNYTPPDNAMAISNGGRIVAVDNEDISYFNETGTSTGVSTHSSFFSGLASSSYLFDPKVIYDSKEDRFIYVLLHGNHYTNSKIFVCFSKSNDPENDGWEIYELPGNPLNDYSWTDYPSIGISNDELFISTNLFYSSGGFNETVIYQIDKFDGYNNASSLTYSLWDGIFDANGGRAFTVVPASYGQQGAYGPNMYFVSSRSGGSTRFYFYEITDNLSGSATLTVDDIIASYSVAADGNQAGSSSLVDVGDCRVQSAFYLNGIIHAVHAGEYLNSGYSGIVYHRIPVDNPNDSETESFGETGIDYAYPSLASFGLNECDQSVMVGALRTGSTIYPEMRVVNCDNDMNWSSSAQIIAGQAPISFIGSPERWGDYSCMQRKHNAVDPEVWMAGCYTIFGNRYRTRIAEIKGDYTPAVGPTIDFYSNDSLGSTPYFVNFYDNSTNNPVSWEWTFEGGVPNVSTLQNPLVAYTDTGWFDVKLVAWNDDCFDSLRVDSMIQVVETLPTDTDTILIGGVVEAYVIDGDTYQLFNGELVPLSIEEAQVLKNRTYPNPIRSSEMMYVDIEMPQGDMVKARIYDMQGREVKSLFVDYVKAGRHQLGFDKFALSAGQYILKVTTDQKILINEKIIVQP